MLLSGNTDTESYNSSLFLKLPHTPYWTYSIIPQQVCSKVTVNENSDVTTGENTFTSCNLEVSSASKGSSEKYVKSTNKDRTPMTTNVNSDLGRFVLEITKPWKYL